MDESPEDFFAKHPLQRLNSPSRGVSAFIHIIGLSSFAASFKYMVDYPNPANDAWGWHFIYLTIIGLFLATATFTAGIVADVTLSRRTFLLKNALSFCSAPLELVISILYWGLRLIDKRLVLPEWAEISVWADIGFHAMPALMLTIDLLILSPPWTLGSWPALAVSGALALGYWYWVELCFAHNGWYPYPLLELLTIPHRIILFTGSAIVMTLNAALLSYVYMRTNGRHGRHRQTRTAKPDSRRL